jgi:vancomycin resistance protein YoaR
MLSGFSRRDAQAVSTAGPTTTSTSLPYFTIETNEKSYPITYEVLRGGWWNEAAYKKFSNGKTIYERASETNKITKETFPEIFRLIKDIARDIEKKPYDGTIVFNPHSETRFTVSGERCGQALDERSLAADILAALKSGVHQTIAAKIRPIYPKSRAQMTAKLGLRGGYTTYFENNPNRENNIELALSKFNGIAVQKGQSISFNQIVGKRTQERGFETAKIILDGEFVNGVGGGVCQASTTLFNALLLSGIQIDKSSSHSLAVSYVPLGRDAMVSSSTDLCFTNNTGGTIYIETFVENATAAHAGRATVRIYGTKSKVKYVPRVEVTEGSDPQTPVVCTKTYIDSYSGDRLVHSRLVRKSKYKG